MNHGSVRAAHRSVSGLLVVVALLLSPASLSANNPFGAYITVPNLVVPGVPIAELNLNGENFLLLKDENVMGTFTALLWNPTNTIPLTTPPTITTNVLRGVSGMQTAQGPRVFFWGDFDVGGTATRVIEWDGVDWDVPGGAVGGVIPNAAEIRMTSVGPELWLVGSVLALPGIAGPNVIGIYNGTSWQSTGNFVGTIDEIVVVDESPSAETVIVAGDLVSVNGLPLNGVARFDASGNWDDLSGGIPGPITAINAFLDESDQLEIWVTGEPVGSSYGVQRFANGGWQSLPIPMINAFADGLGRFYKLPTVFGDWRIAEFPGWILDGPTVEFSFASPEYTAIAWNPTTGLYRPGSEWSNEIIQFEATSGLFPSGNYRIFSNGEVREWVATEIEFIRGDTNGDGTVNIADPIRTLETLFSGGAPLPCGNAADVDESSSVTVGDAILTFEYLFAMGSPPPAPFPQCGFIPTIISYDCPTLPNCP